MTERSILIKQKMILNIVDDYLNIIEALGDVNEEKMEYKD